jgi:hypothetical protein
MVGQSWFGAAMKGSDYGQNWYRSNIIKMAIALKKTM